MDYVTTDGQFLEFIKECDFWIDLLQLRDWEVRYWHRDLEGNLATCAVNRTAKVCDISFALVWQERKPNLDLVREAASHEVLELLLDDFEYNMLAISNEEERAHCRERDRHAIIHRLQYALNFLREE